MQIIKNLSRTKNKEMKPNYQQNTGNYETETLHQKSASK